MRNESTMRSITLGILLLGVCVPLFNTVADETKLISSPEFTTQVYPIFAKYCRGCHTGDEADAEYRVDTFAGLIHGGENGKAVVAGKPDASLLLQRMTDADDPMPPEGEPAPSKKEIAIIREWIKQGAPEGTIPATMSLPVIPLQAEAQEPIHTMAWLEEGKSLLLGRLGRIEKVTLDQKGNEKQRDTLVDSLSGPVNDIVLLNSTGKNRVAVAVSGTAGVSGEVVQFQTETGEVLQKWTGHEDTIYAVAVSSDQSLLATGSYDQTILLWDRKTGELQSTLKGHNGAVYDLAFRPDGQLLASCSSDRTIKLWDVKTSQRLETFSEPTQEQTTLLFNIQGDQLIAGGADNRMRVWEIGPQGQEGTNRLLVTRYAHEAPLLEMELTEDGLYLLTTAQDKLIKTWKTEDYTQQKVFSTEQDWVSRLQVTSQNDLAVSLMDGSWKVYSHIQAATDRQLSAPLPERTELAWDAAKEDQQLQTLEEADQNNTIKQAQALVLPVAVNATFQADQQNSSHPLGDLDWYQFEAKQGQPWILETSTKQAKQPSDTRLEIYHPNGERVVRLLLKSVRDSYVTFRKVNARENDIRFMNWEEMELRDYVYVGGEVLRIFRMPQGPDSGFRFFTSKGARRTYFGSTGVTHDLEDPVYVVTPYAADAEMVENGLPVFPVYYENDDDGWHELGTDSRIDFTAPADGTYFVRVSEVKQAQGAEHSYSLTIRKPNPGFTLSVQPGELKLAKGSGQNLKLQLDRRDEYEGPVTVRFENVPTGLVLSQPVVIEQGHLEANAAAFCLPETELSKEQWEAIEVIATGKVAGETIEQRNKPFAKAQLTDPAKIGVRFVPDHPVSVSQNPEWADYPVIELSAGSSTTATIHLDRKEFKGEMKFDVQNLPHGLIVDNIGLSGILVRTGEDHRQVFLTAAQWVQPQERLIHAMSQGEGKQISQPVVVRVVP